MKNKQNVRFLALSALIAGLYAVLTAVLAVICMLAFWLTAVLMQPPVLEEPQPETIVAEQQ